MLASPLHCVSSSWLLCIASHTTVLFRNMVRNSVCRMMMHGRWWINDPDCILLRNTTHYSEREIIGIATVKAMSGEWCSNSHTHTHTHTLIHTHTHTHTHTYTHTHTRTHTHTHAWHKQAISILSFHINRHHMTYNHNKNKLHGLQIRDVLVMYMKSNGLEMDGGQQAAPTHTIGNKSIYTALSFKNLN